jgi:potassium-dependent mechanosensitive channel
MNDFLYLIAGWSGLLLRGSVLLQIGVVLTLLVAYRAWRLRWRPSAGSWLRVVAELVVIAALQVACFGLGLARLPAGLVQIVLQLFAVWTVLDGLRLLLRRLQPPEAVEAYWYRAVRPLFVVLVLLALIERLDGLGAVASIELLELFGERLTLGGALLLLTLPYFLVVLSELPVLLLGAVLERLMGMTAANRKVFELILRYLLIGLGVLWLGNQIGLNGTAVAAIAGGLSVGLGFGIKEVFSNFVSGIWLLFEGSVRPGEILLFQGDPVEVRRLGLRAATLWRSRDNVELVVPNQIFFTDTTTTYTGTDSTRRSEVLVAAAYRHDPDAVIALLEQVANANPRVLAEPAPKALLLQYGESSIDYGLRFWIANPMSNSDISSELRRAIWHTFREQAIEMPFPQRVLSQAGEP